MSDQAKAHVARLRDFRSRKNAMDALIACGDDAVPALIEALGAPEENVRWAARSVLVSIESKAVTGALVGALDDADRKDEAARALAEITGETLGTDRQAWAHYLSTGAAPSSETSESPAEKPATVPSPPSEQFSDEELVNAAIENSDVQAEHRGKGAILTVPIEGGRQQRVTVSFAATDRDGEPLVVVYTECGPAEEKNYEWALRQNLRMAFGAVGIRNREDEPTFVMVNTHLRSTVTPEDLRRTVLLLARKGDRLEAALTESDER